MKKSVLAMALIILISGCSTRSLESSSLAVDGNSSVQTDKSSSSSASETRSEETSTSAMVNSTSTESNNNLLFLEKVNDILDGYGYVTNHSITENDNFYSATYITSGSFLKNKQDICTFVMFYTDDVNLICSTIIDNVNNLIGYMDLGSDFYDLYINDANNNHIVTISNADYISLQTEPCVYWENALMQERYKDIEENEVFKDFDIKVVNE